MKKNVCLILFILSAVAVNAQRSRIDSLYGLLQKERTDTGKIWKMQLLGKAYADAGNDSALFYYKEALRKSEQLQYTEGVLSARGTLAFFLYSTKNDYATALDLYLQNLKAEKQTGDTNRIFFDTRDVGFIYERIDDFEKEFEYVNSLKTLINSGIFKDSNKIENYKTVVNNRFGGLYDKLNNQDSAKYYKMQVYQYGLRKNRPEWVALGGMGLGRVYRTMNQKDSALYYYRLCMPVALEAHRRDLYRTCLLGIGQTYWSDEQKDSAFYYVEKAFRLSERENDYNQMMNTSALLAEIYYAKHQPDSAYTFLKRSTILKDSIYSGEKISRIQSLSLKESLQKQQQEQAEKEAVAAYKSKVQTYGFIAGIAVMLIVIFILYRNNRQRQLANKKIEKAYNDLRATQAQLVQSEKMASLGELTAGIAHEIQNPLNFVNNFSEVSNELLDEMVMEFLNGNANVGLEIREELRENLEKINHHGKRADAIVKGMLQHSQKSTGQKEPTDINKLADEYLRLSYHGLRAKDKEFNADIKTEFDETIGNIKIIPQDIGRVLLNLYNNAFYAVKPPIPLKGEHYAPIIMISTKRINDKVEIRVADNGSGIPQKIVDKIFQPFFTTKPTGQGTGLGLSLSYDIVKAHGGEIKVESKEGEGTTFIVQLPVS